MPVIAIDCRFASTPSGLGRYTRELVSHLLQRDDPLEYVLLIHDDAKDWITTLSQSDRWKTHIVRAGHYSIAEHRELPNIFKSIRVDLLFSLHFNVPWSCPVPFVVTIHDLILHRYPNAAPFWKRLAYRALVRHAVLRAQRIITVSTFVQGEIATFFGPDISSRIHVIHEGVSPVFRRRSEAEQDRVCRAFGIKRPFFLYVGNAKQHKNLPLLLQAWEALDARDSHLVLVTGGPETQRLRLPPRTIRIPHIDDHDLSALYSAARAFVTPSLYEGFCLPVVEALACTCPVIAVHGGPLAEVTQGQALLIEPTIDALRSALQSPPPPPASFHTPCWETAVEKTVDVLKNYC